MADLMREFLQAVGLAWLSFGFGVLLFRIGCKDRQTYFLSRALLFLSPAVLTCFGVHAVRENQTLAAVVAAKKAEGVDDERVVHVAEEHVFQSPGGIRLTRSEFSDGRRFAQLSNLFGRIGAGRAGAGRAGQPNWRFDEPVLGVPKGEGTAGISWH